LSPPAGAISTGFVSTARPDRFTFEACRHLRGEEQLLDSLQDEAKARQGFTIFREAEMPRITAEQTMSAVVAAPEQRAAMERMYEAGWARGEETRFLFHAPGFSLLHAWFKQDYPLPLHSHDTDCLYYVVAGSLTLGTEELGPGDGFFVPANARYTYRPGPDGVEVLEFRQTGASEFRIFSKGEAFWAKSLERVLANLPAWEAAKRPGR
jgi:mannose-6-phosphate isomerase-like protein (cupin superfamily)